MMTNLGYAAYTEIGPEAVVRLRSQCSYPWWCNVVGGFFEDRGEACAPFTPEEIRACQQFGPAMPPEAAEESKRAADAALEAYCDLHPEECANYVKAVARCSWYEKPSTGDLTGAICEPNLALLAGLTVGGFVLLTVLLRR